jgi:hypothetical protein
MKFVTDDMAVFQSMIMAAVKQGLTFEADYAYETFQIKYLGGF